MIFSHSKKNNEDVYQITPWYVRFNPKKMLIFPVNALALYLFYMPAFYGGWIVFSGTY